MKAKSLRIGTSGWNYNHWKEKFYPLDISKSKWLEFYSDHFDTVEVNATFYRLPTPKTFENWYKRTPENFKWAVKASKYITHTKRLNETGEPLERLYQSVQNLKEKTGPILFQLPPSLTFEKDRFQAFLKDLRSGYRHALEIRHASWIDEGVFKLLEENNLALCISDTAGRYPYCEAVTADFLYIRLHGSKKLYASEYTEAELQAWAKKIREWNRDTFIYLDNDHEAYAVKNADRLKEILTLSPVTP